jgi:DNA-directed RNA polymerase specialized sigma24 family protein
MVTGQGNTPRSWRHRQRRSSAKSASETEQDCQLGTSGALHEAADLADHAEAALVPGEPEPDHSAEERLAADQRLVDVILTEGLQGPRHQQLERELIKYAVRVLDYLLRNGEIFSKASRLGRPAGDSDAWLDFTDIDREDLARDMVADALPVFTRAVFEERRWSPRRGASLRTYLVNACVLQFSGLYRKWLGQRRAVPGGLEIDPGDGNRMIDPARAVINHDEAMRAFSWLEDRQMQEVLARRAVGFTAEDAAELAGLTPRAAEGRLARIRRNVKSERDSTELSGREQDDTSHGGRWEQ